MKRLVTLLALLALSALPAFAYEGPALPAPGPDAAVSAPSCALEGLPAAPAAARATEEPAWLSGQKPWIWTGNLDELFKLNQNCAQYCQGCGGCCAILGPGSCACC